MASHHFSRASKISLTCHAVAFVVSGLMLSGDALAADVTWTGPSNGQWSTGTNWSGGAVPGASDNVFTTSSTASWLTLSSTFSPSIANLTVSNNAIRISGNTGVLSVSGSINVTNQNFLVSTSGTSSTYYAIQTPLINATNANLVVTSNSWLTAGPSSTWNFSGIDLNTDSSSNASNFRINGATVNSSGGNSYGVMLSRGSTELSTLYMDAGTLTAVRIGIGRQQNNFQNSGTGTLQWSGGTIANYSGQDMLWNSYDITDNYGFQVNLTGTADKTLSAASGRTVRFGPNSTNTNNSGVITGTNTTGAYLTGSTGRLVVDGGGTVRLYQSNSYSGEMKINNGTLTLVSGTETYNSVFGTYNATIAPSALEIATSGTLNLQNGSGLAGSGSISFTGGLLQFSGSSAADLSSRIVGSTGAIRIDSGINSVTFASALASSNTGGLTKSGAGTLRLTATPAYTGTTNITAGTLDFGLGSGTTTWTNPIVGSSGTFRYSGAGSLVVSSTVSSANSFSGTVVVDSGVLQMGVNDFTANRGFVSASSFTVNSGATLAITRDSIGVVPMTLNSGTLTTGTIGTGAFNGAAQQLGTLTMNAGTIITGKGLNSSYNSFALANDVTVAGSAMSQMLAGAGTDNGIHLTNSGSGGSRTFTVNDVTTSAAADLTVSASLLNTFGSLNPANLVKAGLGTMVLSGSNGYTGTTTVSAGRLTVNGSLGGGGVSVAAGAVLSGSGTIGGTVTVGGTLSPGNSPGLLTVSSLVLTSTATTLMEIDGLTRGSLYDGINLTTSGGLTYGGALSIAFGLGSAVPDQTTFDLFNFTGSPTGDFASVSSTGLYTGSWSQVSSGTWSLVSGAQTLTFSTATGDIIVVPEPGALVLAGVGVAAAAYARRRRR